MFFFSFVQFHMYRKLVSFFCMPRMLCVKIQVYLTEKRNKTYESGNDFLDLLKTKTVVVKDSGSAKVFTSSRLRRIFQLSHCHTDEIFWIVSSIKISF